MRKTLSLLLASVMVFGTIGTAFATTDASNGTIVSYTGTGSEAYTITVPAKLTPSSNGDVEVNGTWASNRMLTVTAPETVSLLNDISGADEKVLDVTFEDIAQEGNNNTAIRVVENVAVGAIQDALFGTWSGKIVYTVGMEDIAGPVTMLDGDGQTVNTFAMYDVRFRSSAPMDELQNVQVNGEVVDPENYTVSEGSTIVTFKPDFVAGLGNGNHTVDINSQGGTASGTFNVTNEMPGDSTVYEGAETSYGGSLDMSNATEINPEEFAGRTLQPGDAFEYGDYMYVYSPYASNMDGWGVFVKDKTKTEYGSILSKIAGKPVANMTWTFEGCYNLTVSPVIPSSVTDLVNTFAFCTNLTKAPEIPNSVTNMNSTFYGCSKLTDAPIIPEGVTNLGSTFSNCTSLTTAPEIPSSVTNMSCTFFGCTNLKTYVGAPEGTADGDFSGYVIPEGVTDMYGIFGNDYPFIDATCMPIIAAPVIPSSVTKMDCAFGGCANLTGIVTINANPSSYTSCFNATTQPIALAGSSTMLADIAAGYDNVTVAQQ